jgi:hypothetical protein
LRTERRAIAYACAAAAVAGFVQPHGLAGPLLFCSTIGIALALMQGPGRRPHLDLCEQSAPLFGRELARAKALVPCIAAVLATTAYCVTASFAGSNDMPWAYVAAMSAVVPSTLTALSATLREGSARTLYIVIACGIALASFGLARYYADWLAADVAFAAFASYLALRQYGEALARYDPV